jgi:hypothetical protein
LNPDPRLGARASTPGGSAPEEDAMKRNPHPHVPRPAARRTTEIYCRRDNRVYEVCPHVAAGSRCRCLFDVETADALFESEAPEAEPGH